MIVKPLCLFQEVQILNEGMYLKTSFCTTLDQHSILNTFLSSMCNFFLPIPCLPQNDRYLNVNSNQQFMKPNILLLPTKEEINEDFARGIIKFVGCHHQRSLDYYISSVTSKLVFHLRTHTRVAMIFINTLSLNYPKIIAYS